MPGFSDTEAYLARVLSPDQKRAEGLDSPPEQGKDIIIECSDGRKRHVTFQPGTNLISRSVVVDGIPIEDGEGTITGGPFLP